MPKVSVVDMSGKVTGELELCESVFGAEINKAVLHQAVVAYLANQRQGNQSTLTRAEVRGGGAKPWRQKGTGRARQGSIRAPQWTHGGVVFAPKPRSYRISVPKAVRRLAMKSALTCKVNENELLVIDKLEIQEAKTKFIAKMLKDLGCEKKALIVTNEVDEKMVRASGNIPGVKTTPVGTLNVYDILNCDSFVVMKDAVAKLEEVYA